MKRELVIEGKNFFVISFLIGLVIIILSLSLNPQIFESARLFGIFSGATICILSVSELFRLSYIKNCPICGSKIDSKSQKCENCGYLLKKVKKS